MIQIIIKNSNQCQLEGEQAVLKKLFEQFRYKHHNAWHILAHTNTKWDGYVKYISNYGVFRIGLLGKVYEAAKAITDNVKIIDKRRSIGIVPELPKRLGDLTLRPEQTKALKSILNNRVAGVPFIVCCANLAVNFGKSLLFCAIHKAYKSKLKTILLLNDSDLFNQFQRELPPLLPDETITFIRGGKVDKWTNFNVAMVPSLNQNLDTYANNLASMDITLIDEADTIDNKTYKTVIEHLHQTLIRVGLSGTLYKGKLKKDQIPHMNIRCFIGDVVEEVMLVDQMKKGRSTPIVVKSIKLDYPVEQYPTYEAEYQAVVVESKQAYRAILDRIKYNLAYGRTPMLIATKFIDHTDKLEKYLTKHLPKLKVRGVHHKTQDRTKVIEAFRLGEIDILVATTIISRGKNIPLVKYTCNAASMDAEEKTIQLVGRSVRKHQSKTKAIIDDLIFPGKYLTKHGNHRKNYYLRENLHVINIPRKPKKRKNKRK